MNKDEAKCYFYMNVERNNPQRPLKIQQKITKKINKSKQKIFKGIQFCTYRTELLILLQKLIFHES